MKILEEEIKRISSATIYRRGLEYFKEGRVHLYVRDDNELAAVVDDEEVYNVCVHLNDEGKVTDSLCTCPYYTTMDCACKHIVATLKVRQKELDDGVGFADENDRLAKELCTEYECETHEKIKLNMAFVMRVDKIPHGELRYSISVSAGIGAPEQIKGVEGFLSAFSGDGEYKLSKFRKFKRDEYIFSENDRKILEILAESRQNKDSGLAYAKNVSATEIGALTAKRLMPYLINARSELVVNDMRLDNMQLRDENPDIQIDVRATDSSISVTVPESGFAVVPDGSWFYFSGDIYHTDEAWRRIYMPVYRTLNGGTRTQIEFAGENRLAFAAYALPKLKKLSGAVFDGIDDVIVREKPEIDVYFDCPEKSVTAVVIVRYGNIRIKIPQSGDADSGKIILRDYAAENEVLRYFGAFHLSDGRYVLDDNDEIYKFMFQTLSELEKRVNIVGSESFDVLREKEEPELAANVSYSSELDLLEVGFESTLTEKEIEGILSAVRLRRDYYRKDNGRFLRLGNSGITDLLFNQLGFNAEDVRNGSKRISKYHALYLEGVAENGKISADDSFEKLIADVKAIRADIPGEIDNVLRPYQRDSVHWLTQLAEFGLGGILADDMGLGKTLEVIAFVMSRKHDRPALVVAPSALLYNWSKEIKRFAPNAKTVIIDGTKEERRVKAEKITDEDFVITSYPLLRRDSALYCNINFSFCFIDEAQYIKNPKTMNARGVKLINADCRFALTGTPIENSLTELWSIFDFIMPGYFGKRHAFAEMYERPVTQGDENAAELLRKRIKPFVMRRMKGDVLTELPEKIENTAYAELVPAQKKLYEAYLAVARREVDRILNEGESDMLILSLLTRLRQICCHPSLFDSAYEGESGKLELLHELVSSAALGGHRVLVFSQFTSMLKIIREKFAEWGITCFYLDGSTPPHERTELSERFNGGECMAFLISLKAGGTGLNLIGADTVIHYDPWWNPAVTDQASDRAYRIGQTRAVQVIKLAASGTIEERILKLQERKRSLANDIITKNSATLSNLTNAEILSLFEQD